MPSCASSALIVVLLLFNYAPSLAQSGVDSGDVWAGAIAGRGGGSNTVNFLGGSLTFPLVGIVRGSVEWAGWHGTGPVCEPLRGCRQEASNGSVLAGGVEGHLARVGRVRPFAGVMVGLFRDPLGPSNRAPIGLVSGGAHIDVAERWALRAGLRYVLGISSDAVDLDGNRLHYWAGAIGIAYRWPD